MSDDSQNWMVVTCAPNLFGEDTMERPYIRHHDRNKLKFHLVSTYKSMDPVTCLCGDPIPEDVIRQFNFRCTQFNGIEQLPVPEKSGIVI